MCSQNLVLSPSRGFALHQISKICTWSRSLTPLFGYSLILNTTCKGPKAPDFVVHALQDLVITFIQLCDTFLWHVLFLLLLSHRHKVTRASAEFAHCAQWTGCPIQDHRMHTKHKRRHSEINLYSVEWFGGPVIGITSSGYWAKRP